MKKKSVPLVLAFLLFLNACRKDNLPPPQETKPGELSVKLQAGYLSSAQVDSAFIIWTINGQVHLERMEIRNDSLLYPLKNLPEGKGELCLHIFSNKNYSRQYPGQWLLKKNLQLKRNNSLALQGPDSFYDQDWLPRVELSDAIGHAAVIALRPDDAYFMIKDPGHEIYSLAVDRSYWQTKDGIALAGRDIWSCQQSCTDREENEFFKTLPGRIGDKPWNHISIYVLFEINAGGEGWVLSLEHEP